MARRVLVTGAGGFVRCDVCRRLLEDGHEVHVLVRPRADLWRVEDVRHDLVLRGVELRDAEALAKAVDKAHADGLFHLAAHGASSWQVDLEAIFATDAVAARNWSIWPAIEVFEAFVLAGSSSA